MTIIWVDDIRNPKKFLRNYSQYSEVIWVKHYIEFIRVIQKWLPKDSHIAISFDHDLGEDYSGYDCAKFLVEYCLDHDIQLPSQIMVHSKNPVGANNIRMLLSNFRQFQKNSIK